MTETLGRRNAILLGVALLAVALGTMTAVQVHRHRESVARGRSLFNGEIALVGRITGQTDPLPTAATRCANCHATADAGTTSGAAPTFAVALNRTALTKLRSRRGGPASRFDESTMCTLVRSGIDPAYIIIPQAMPRYDLVGQDCSALWNYLQSL